MSIDPPRVPDHDVIVVGFGPVGAVLAGLLARRGLDVLVVERDTDIFNLPRAAHLDSEVMRILQEVGCADTIAPSLIANEGMDFLTADRQVLLRMRSTEPTPSGWPSSNFFHQPGVERAIRAAAIDAGVQTRLGAEVATVDDHGDQVTVELVDGSVLTARYVVGCDGARSTVRRLLGITMHDLEFEEPWLVLDTILHSGVPLPSSVALQVCDAARPHTLVPMPPPRFRFEFMVLPGDDPAVLASETVARQLMAPWVDPSGVDIERSAVYTFHGLIAHEWRKGRVLLAGDAAHQMPPFLGQGMCSGLRDAANLAWKLDRVIRGRSTPELLDTYQAEREPHVRQIVESAVGFGRLICTTDPDVAAARDRDMLAARAAGGGNVGGGGGPALPVGPLVAGLGRPSLQPCVAQDDAPEVRLDDVVGQRFAVLLNSAQPLGPGWADLDSVVLDAEHVPEVADVLAALGATAAVIRPDRYVLWAGSPGDPMPDEARRLLTR